MARNPLGDLGNNLGDYLREQRLNAKLSVRQLSALAGISNPYLSQIERGVKKPSAEILQQIAKGLSISAETLYIQAGLLDPEDEAPTQRPTARDAIASDLRLTSRQRQTLIDIYDSFVGVEDTAATDAPGPLDEPVADPSSEVAAPVAKPKPKRPSASTKARTKSTTRKTTTTRRKSSASRS